MKRLVLQSTPLAGLLEVQRLRLGDDRGFLSRLFCTDELAAAGWTLPVRQVNHSHTVRRGCLRGLHFQQAPHAETKLVSCLRGAVYDVAVDLRAGSSTFLHWYAAMLTADNGCALLIPEGFAHGFQTMTDDVDMVYCHSAAHVAESEGGLHPLDARLAITWPLQSTDMSPRDQAHPFIDTGFRGLTL